MVRCEEFYERWSVDENWCEKCPEAVREINNYIDFISRLETTYGIDKQQAMAGITERAARPLIREKDPEVKERSVLEVANRLNREQDRKKRGFKVKRVQVGDIKKVTTPLAFASGFYGFDTNRR